MERRKIAIKTAVFLLSICMLIVSLPLTTAYATKLIPDKYFGTYDNETDPTAMLVLSSGPTVAFKGVFYGYGRIAAANATAIYFDPLLTDAGITLRVRLTVGQSPTIPAAPINNREPLLSARTITIIRAVLK